MTGLYCRRTDGAGSTLYLDFHCSFRRRTDHRIRYIHSVYTVGAMFSSYSHSSIYSWRIEQIVGEWTYVIHATYCPSKMDPLAAAKGRRTRREGQAEKEKQRRTSREGQAEKDKQRKTSREGQAEKDNQRRTSRERQAKKDEQRR